MLVGFNRVIDKWTKMSKLTVDPCPSAKYGQMQFVGAFRWKEIYDYTKRNHHDAPGQQR